MKAHIGYLSLLAASLVVFAETDGKAVSRPFKVPEQAINVRENDSGKTWRMTGELPLPVSEAEMLFRQRIEAEGFVFLHEIPMQQGKVKKLLAWKKDNSRLILFIWEINDKKTGFSWGVSDE